MVKIGVDDQASSKVEGITSGAIARGVAMGNGVPALRERADYVTDTVTNNGIEKAFRKLGLI